MISVNVMIDQNQLEEANKILESIGLSMDIAIGIFIKRIIKEKGFPLVLKQPDSETKKAEVYVSNESSKRRTSKAITASMVEEVWNAFKIYQQGRTEIVELSDEVSEKTSMNKGSAFIYLNIIAKMVKGEKNTRSMKPKDFEFFLGKIRKELGEHAFENSLKSIGLSIPYWRNNLPTFADSMQEVLKNRTK
jgi:addiction module RelB/DinJ family antitoxin